MLSVACSLMVATLGGCQVPSAPSRTLDGSNVLLVTIDTLRADHVGAYGYERATTPNLDRLVSKGVRFANAVSVSSWTLPAHASLLTGLYPAEHGVVTDRSALPPSARTLAGILGDHGYETFGVVSHIYLAERWGFPREFQAFDSSVAVNSQHRPVAEAVVDHALDWLDHRKDPSRPFFLWVHVFDPHWDYSPPAPWNEKFDPDYDGKMTGDYQSLAPYIRALGRGEPPPLSQRDLEHLLALYDGEIAYADHHLGRLFDRLRQSGEIDKTLVVVASDHGEEFMEHGSLEGHQWTLFDEVIRVPLLVRFPHKLYAGTVVEPQVSTVGTAGMILDALGIEHSLPTLMDRVDPDLAARASPTEALLDLTARGRYRTTGLRTEKFKLLRNPDGSVELYARPATGHEKENLAERRADVVATMSARLDDLLSDLHGLPDAGAQRAPLDPRTRERLRSLGYAR